MKTLYDHPCVTAIAEVALEKDFLGGSIVDNISSVETTGQEVGSYDFGMNNGESFNFVWTEGDE